MRSIPRYVFIQLLMVFIVTLTGMTLLMLLAGVGMEAVKQGLGLGPIVRLMPYMLPNALRFAVPGTVLFAACSVYGRMSGSGEVLAIKSLGISPMAIIWPGFILAFVVSLVAVWLNDVAVTWGMRGVQRVVIQSVEQIAYGMLRTQRSYVNSRFSINVKGVEDRKLIRPIVVLHETNDSPPITLTAREAELQCDRIANTLTILLTDGTFEAGKILKGSFDHTSHVIPLSDASPEAGGSDSPSRCPLRQIPREIAKQRQQVRLLEQSLAAEAAYQMLSGEFDALTDQQWNVKHNELAAARCRVFRLQTEPWRRWANGFSCLFFVIVGAPLAIRLRNCDFLTSFFICFLPILLVYYPMLAYGVDRAKCGELPPYAVWLGNVILLAAGFWLFRKVLRY